MPDPLNMLAAYRDLMTAGAELSRAVSGLSTSEATSCALPGSVGVAVAAVMLHTKACEYVASKTAEGLTITLARVVPESQCEDILTNFWEGGHSTFWAQDYGMREQRHADDGSYRALTVHTITLKTPSTRRECNEPPRIHELRAPQVAAAISAIFATPGPSYPAIKRDLLNNLEYLGCTDAETADIIVQFALFGGEIYS